MASKTGVTKGLFLGTLETVLGHAEAVRAPPLQKKMHAPVCNPASKLSSTPPAGASSAHIAILRER